MVGRIPSGLETSSGLLKAPLYTATTIFITIIIITIITIIIITIPSGLETGSGGLLKAPLYSHTRPSGLVPVEVRTRDRKHRSRRKDIQREKDSALLGENLCDMSWD